MDLGYKGQLFILAFDHRGSFKKKMFGIVDETPADTQRLREAKRLVWDGFVLAHSAGLPEGAGILVDEEMGTAVLREAIELGVPSATPVERSGQDVFDFEYGEDFRDHIAAFPTTFSKVLVRWNPDDDIEVKKLQGTRLRLLSDWLHETDRKFLFELLVPASEPQAALAGGDPAVYDAQIRPGLMLDVIGEIRAAGIEPDIWKIEGVDTPSDCDAIARMARADHRGGVRCVVLGRGADDARVDGWLRAGASVPGYSGFAIGRSIWWDALAAWHAGTMERQAAVEMIAANYRRFIDGYREAAETSNA